MNRSSFDEPALVGLEGRWVRFVLATRPGFLAASVVPVLLGLAIVHAADARVHGWLALLTLVAAVVVHAGVNVLNDYYDAPGSDAINRDRVFPYTGGSRFIQAGIILPAQMAVLGWALLLAGGGIGLYLAAHAGPALLLVGMVGMALGWAYSAPPLRLSDRGLGEIGVAVGFGSLIPLGAYYVQTGTFSSAPVLIGMPYAILVGALLFMNQFPDLRADAASGKRNWVVRLGSARATWAYAGLVLSAYACLTLEIILGILPALAWLALLPLALNARAAVRLHRHHDHPKRLAPALRMNIAATLSHGLLLACALFAVHS